MASLKSRPKTGHIEVDMYMANSAHAFFKNSKRQFVHIAYVQKKTIRSNVSCELELVIALNWLKRDHDQISP